MVIARKPHESSVRGTEVDHHDFPVDEAHLGMRARHLSRLVGEPNGRGTSPRGLGSLGLSTEYAAAVEDDRAAVVDDQHTERRAFAFDDDLGVVHPASADPAESGHGIVEMTDGAQHAVDQAVVRRRGRALLRRDLRNSGIRRRQDGVWGRGRRFSYRR